MADFDCPYPDEHDCLAEWPGDPDINGYTPPVGEHVHCYRPTDGKSQCGIVTGNRAGLFLERCNGWRVVMTAACWVVTPLPPLASCQRPRPVASPARLV